MVELANIFKNYRTNQVLKIFHDLTCNSENLICLLQYRICKLQYFVKYDTNFNIRFNNHGKDTKSEKTILACKHSNEFNYNFQQHAEFTLTKQIRTQTTN